MSRLCLLLLQLLPLTVRGDIGPDGLCALSVFSPFTTNNGTQSAVGLFTSPNTTIGHSQLAAAIMAIQQFNERNSSVVPQLAELVEDCNIQVDLEKSLLYDSGADAFGSARALYRAVEEPCAIIGPFDDSVAEQLATLAMAAEIPHVVSRAYSLGVTSETENPYTTTVYPDLLSSARQVASYLSFKERTDHVAIIYGLSDLGLQRYEALRVEFRERMIGHMGFSFAEVATELQYFTDLFPPITALREIKQRGQRTIVFCLDNPKSSLQPIADAIEELDMNNGDYFFVFHDRFDPNQYFDGANQNLTDFVKGSAWIVTVPEFHLDYTLPFGASWLSQGKDTVDTLNEVIPVEEESSPGFIFTNDDFFQTTEAEYGAGFMFDAIMAALIGACQAHRSPDGSISGSSHQAAIRNLNFTGATGTVAFGAEVSERAGTRQEGTVPWVAVNFIDDGDVDIPEFVNAEGEWQSDQGIDFVYAKERTSGPPLRAPTKANYLTKGLRVFGFTLMSIAMACGVGSAIWVFMNRKHRVLTASQPPFLYLICLGTIVQSASIFTISFDESYGWTKGQLDKACMAMPWLLALGHILVYASIFTKLWRVNKVLQFTRRKVSFVQVGAPMFLLLLGAIVILVLWTVIDPLTWERDEINEITGENVGTCESRRAEAFAAPLLAIILLPTVMTGFMAYKTKDVDEQYTEGWWIFTLITIHLQIMFVTTPVIIILNDISTSGRYLGFLLMMWSFPMSTLCSIFIPKMTTHLYAVKGWGGDGSTPKRGERGNVRVSGLTDQSSNKNKNQYHDATFSSTSKPSITGSATKAPENTARVELAGSSTFAAQQDPSTILQSSITSPLATKGEQVQEENGFHEGETAGI